MQIHRSADAESLAENAALWLCRAFARIPGRIALALAGGSTPRLLYRLLAEPRFAEQVPWPRLHLFWGDERFVTQDHPDSNFRMVREALLDRVPIPSENIYPVDTNAADAEAAASAYEGTLRRFAAAADREGAPLFDIVLLGVGEDGHTASLFPGTPSLEERERWVVGVEGARPEPRITLTYPALAASGDLVFLVCGVGKRAVLTAIREGADLPAARARSRGETHWFLDEAAAPPSS